MDDLMYDIKDEQDKFRTIKDFDNIRRENKRPINIKNQRKIIPILEENPINELRKNKFDQNHQTLEIVPNILPRKLPFTKQNHDQFICSPLS